MASFHYHEDNLIWKGDQWREPTADETDVLLGFPRGCTRIGADGRELPERVRLQLLGSAMHVDAVARWLDDLPVGHRPQGTGHVEAVDSGLPEQQPSEPGTLQLTPSAPTCEQKMPQDEWTEGPGQSWPQEPDQQPPAPSAGPSSSNPGSRAP